MRSDELTNDVLSARYPFITERLALWIENLDETPEASAVVIRLQDGLSFEPWYHEVENSVGSATLAWPKGRRRALGMKVLLFRGVAAEEPDIAEIGHTFIYVGNNINDNAQAAPFTFRPFACDLIRLLEDEMTLPEQQIPASDRIVALNHNQKESGEQSNR